MKAENVGNGGYPGEDSAEHENNSEAHMSFRPTWKYYAEIEVSIIGPL